MSEWWRDAVFYEIYVRSFADADGDGTGDLPGIRSRLPYLQRLGVDALWLTPFYPSPGADHGYDVSDYVDVDPRFGTLADFDALLADAHELGRPRGDDFAWRESPPGTLVFERGEILCLVNVSAAELELPEGELLLASDPAGAAALPANTAAWIRKGAR